MKEIEPQVYLIAEPKLNLDQIIRYLNAVGGQDWLDGIEEKEGAPETLIEFMGKACYRSWAPGLNPNVKRVRSDQKQYIANILSSKHGSVLEHVNFSFMFHGVSRVFTHELVRHRAGVAISQESMRFVRLDDIPFWMPEWAKQDEELMARVEDVAEDLESLQTWMAEHFGLDDDGVDFHEKKAKTSFMRRFAPDGVATSIGWTANVRALRHVMEARTAEGAEEEIRIVFDMVAQLMTVKHPFLFGDFAKQDDGSWKPEWSKV